MGRLVEISFADVADIAPPGPWSSVWHTSEALDEQTARSKVLDVLPFGTILDGCAVLGYKDGADGTVVLVRSSYSHS